MDAVQSPSVRESSSLNEQFNRIHQGDCISGMRELDAGSVQLAFADPPFNIGYEYDVYEDRQERDQYLDWSKAWISEVHRVLTDHGTFWLAIGDEYAAELKLLSQQVGFHCRSWVVWYYTFGVNCSRKFSRSHAHLFHFVKDPSNFTFRESDPENRIPSARQLVYGDRRANPQGRLADDTWILRPQDLADCFTTGEDTWYFPRVAGTFKERAGFHGCQMPEQLLGRIVRFCSHAEEIVLDPFAGSSTTLVVAKKLGRRYLGYELSADYATRGAERLKGVRRGDPLDGSPEPLVSAPATPRTTRRGKTSKRSSDTPLFALEMNQLAKLEVLLDEGLIEAFRQTSQGYSVDRLVADPELNGNFLNACRQLGLAGDRRSWNRNLFRLRKAGKLEDIPVDRRTEYGWNESDPYLFASEIALRQMFDRGYPNIDELLCDPDGADAFDRIAESFSPGFSPLQYRWGAIRLAEAARKARMRSAAIELPCVMSPPIDATTECCSAFPPQAGAYVVSFASSGKTIYAGATLNLRERLQRKFGTDGQLRLWCRPEESLCVRFFTIDADPLHALAYQSLLIAEYDPPWNLREA